MKYNHTFIKVNNIYVCYNWHSSKKEHCEIVGLKEQLFSKIHYCF